MAGTSTSFELALRNPSSVYATPDEVLADPRLDIEGRRAILKSWKLDARELAAAEDENMGAGKSSMLNRVDAALAKLDRDARWNRS